MKQRVKILDCHNAEDIEAKTNAELDKLGAMNAMIHEIQLYPGTPNPQRTRVKIWYALGDQMPSVDVTERAKELMDEALHNMSEEEVLDMRSATFETNE